MKEKIKSVEVIIKNPEGYLVEGYLDAEDAMQILSLLKEKIKKVENPYMGYFHTGFEECRQAILKALES